MRARTHIFSFLRARTAFQLAMVLGVSSALGFVLLGCPQAADATTTPDASPFAGLLWRNSTTGAVVSMSDGGTYDIQPGEAGQAIVQDSAVAYDEVAGTLYRDLPSEARGDVVSANLNSISPQPIVWQPGAYELDLYGTTQPHVMLAPWWRRPLAILFTPVAHAQVAPVFLETVRFTIEDVNAKPKVDNVLFLPGIEGSRLYEGTGCGLAKERKLWEPYNGVVSAVLGAGNTDVEGLMLNSDGKSSCPDIYTKTGDIVDSVAGSGIYEPFIEEMNALVASGTINAWQAAAYDWRLSLDDLLADGKETGNDVNFGQATDTPYIAQTLRRLAASSQTGKVTIIAHSNGGLVAKAVLARRGNQAADLVDRVILVAVPQTGAPQDVGSMLLGQDAGLYPHGVPIVSNSVARQLALNSPMAYHLLPSETYLQSIAGDQNHQVVTFEGSAYAADEAAYGSAIRNTSNLDKFVLAQGDGRSQPERNDLKHAAVGNPFLISYANSTHDEIDSWMPPPGIEVDQVAGWGVDSTVSGIDFYTQPQTVFNDVLNTSGQPEYRPVFTEDGDGTVPVPSALAMSTSSPNVKRFWLDLTSTNWSHGMIFSDTDLEQFVVRLLSGLTATSSTISNSQPVSSGNRKLVFVLHSPLTLKLSDSSGNTTGSAVGGVVTENIPGAVYSRLGDVQYVMAPADGSYALHMHGTGSGTFSLDIEEYQGGAELSRSTVANVPVATSTDVSMTIDGIASTSPLSVDEDGDRIPDFFISPQIGTTTAFVSATDPLEYLSYMKRVIGAMSLSRKDERAIFLQLDLLQKTLEREESGKDGDFGNRCEKFRKGDSRRATSDWNASMSVCHGDAASRAQIQLGLLEEYIQKNSSDDHEAWGWWQYASSEISEKDANQMLDMINELELLINLRSR